MIYLTFNELRAGLREKLRSARALEEPRRAPWKANRRRGYGR